VPESASAVIAADGRQSSRLTAFHNAQIPNGDVR
jgi:hypothetical protein